MTVAARRGQSCARQKEYATASIGPPDVPHSLDLPRSWRRRGPVSPCQEASIPLSIGVISGRSFRRLALFDDLHAVAVLVAEGEHGRDALPAQHLVRVDAAGQHPGVHGVGVGGHEPDAGFHAGRQALVRGDQRDRDGRPARRYLDPAAAAAHVDVEALFEAERAHVEVDRPVLVRDRHADRAHAGDLAYGHGHSPLRGPAMADDRTPAGSSVCHGSRASSLAATSVRSSPTTSGGSNGAPKPPDLRLTQPAVSPARLAPWQSQSCAATSAIRSVGTSSTSAAYRYTTAAGFHR